jgi:hypothetical protein
LANWTFLGAAILSAHAVPEHPTEPVPVQITSIDWVPGFCSLLGMLIINLIDKDRIESGGMTGCRKAAVESMNVINLFNILCVM